MEEQDRKKRLLAGKEKLAAFQRKRGKKKKSSPVDSETASEMASKGHGLQSGHSSSLIDPCDLGFTSEGSLSIDESDQGSVTEGDLTEEEDGSLPFVSLERTRLKLEKASERIRELEESVQGKQGALDELAAENALLKAHTQAGQHGNSTQGKGDAPQQQPDQDAYKYKLEEYDEVLKAKDGVIEQLTEALQASNFEKEQAQKESMAQASQLADEIHRLQQQLKQSSELLDHQLGLPAQALIEAKNEILALQNSLDVKDMEVESMTEAIRQRDVALKQLAEKYQEVSQHLSAITEQNAVLSQVSEDQEHWHGKQQQWSDMEHHLKKENAKYMAEIEALRDSLWQRDSSITELNASMSAVTSEKSARITQLEVNIGAYEKEISSLKDHISCTEGEMQQELISLKDVISKKDSTIVNFERQLAELSKACAEKDASYAHFQSELHLREEEILSLKGNISSSRKEIDELLSQNDELRSANGTLSVEITNLRSDLSEKESTLQDLIQRSDSAAQQSKLRVAELERSCAEYREEINQHMDDLSLNCREINDLNQQCDQLKEECSKYREENQALKDTVTRKDSELEQLHKSLLDSSDEKEQRITHLMSEVGESTQEIGRLQKTLQSCEMEIKELTNAKDQVNSEKLNCMEEILTLKVTVSETDTRFENLKLQLEASEREHENVVSRLQAEVVSLQENVSSLQENKLCDEKALEEMKERQSVHESKISNLRSALSQKEETVVSLEGELDIKTAKVGDLESSLTRKCEELSQLQEVLSGKESGISEVTALLSQKEKHVRVLEQQIKEKDTEMLSLSQGISNTDTKLYEAQIELERKDCEMQRVVQEVAAKESDCTDLRNRLEDNTYQLEKLSAARDQKESSIKALSADLAEKENTCRDLELELKKVKKNLQECQVDIAEKNATCESLRKELHQKDSSLSDLTITLERKQKSILDLQKCLDEATSKIAQLEKAESEKVLNLEKVLDEKEDIMTDLRFRLSDLSGQNADLDSDNKSLKENVCSLLQVEDQLRQVQNDVSNLREELAAKNTTVEESRDTIESLNLQINSLQSEYDGMLEEKKELRRLLEESKEELQRSADKLKSEKDELQNVLAVSQRDYDRIAESLAAVQAEKQKLVDHIESLQFQKLELTSSKEILMSEKEDLLVKTEEINSQLSDQSSASDTLVFEKDELLIKLDSLETENMQLCEKSAELASEKLELEKELSAKQTALSALQEQVSQLQAELKETSDHRTALQKNYDEKCQELTTTHSSLNEKTQALNALEASVESRLATSVQEAVENATQNYVRRIEELTGEIKDLKNRENEATCTQESLEQKVARLSDSWTVVEGVEAKHQAVDKVMLESGTSLGSSQSAESMESGSEERKPISPVMRGALQTSTSSSSSAQDGRLQELETEVVRLQAILHDRERTVLDSTKGATQQLKKKNEQIKGLNEKTEKQAAQIKTMKERATVMKNDLEALKVKYAALQSQLKTRGVKVTIPQKLEAAIKEKVAEINRLNEQIEIRDAQILTLNVELRKRPDEAEPSTSDAGTSGQKMEPSLNGDAENKIQRIREENSVLVEKLQLITSEHDSAYRSVKVENNILSEQLAEERKLFEKEKATFEEEKKRWELNIRSLSGRHQELYQQTATSNLDILTQLERLKAENAQFKSQVDELSTKLAIHVSRDDEVARLKEDLTKHSRNHELVKMELQAARTSLYELESRNPDVLVYRRKLDDLHATLQVTWIENEELKAQVMQLKYQLGLDAENDEAADEPDGQSNVARQIQKLKLEHAAQTEKLTNELETVKAKAKEIEIEKDSLHTKYQQEIRVKEKEHLNVLNELTRQLEHTRSVLDSLRSEYRHSQQQIQKLEDEKEAMQKSYGQAVEAMRREHQETLHRVRSQAEKSGRTVMVPLKENASADMQVRARLNLLMDEKIKLSKERDQLISERQDLILERELMLAEKMQLVADKDKLAAENAELQDQQQKLGAEGNTGLAKPEQLVCDYEKNLLLKQRHEEEMQALRENLNDGHRAEILLLKKTIISILNEEIRKQMESSEQLLQQIMGSSSHPEVTRAQQMLHAQHVGQLDQLNSRLTEHGILSIRGDETASDMQKMVRYLQQQNQELAEAKETLLERTDAHTPLDRSFAELSDQDSLDIMQRSLEHDGLTEHGDSISMHDSLEDYSEADFRAQIDVLQRENADLRRRIEGDYRNLNVVHSLKKEVVGLQAKYLSVMQRSAIHMRDIDSASQDEDSESLVTPPQREAFEPEIDWKKKYEDLTKETEMLRGRIDALTLSHQLSTKSQSVENLKARYESIMEENEVLRAKLGSYGLPTEGTPEEDSFDLQTKFEAVMKENETLRTKLDNYSMSSSSSQQRDEDWKSKFDCVLKDLDSLKPKSMSMADFGKVGGDVKQGLYELQGFYDSVVKEKEVLQVKLESVQDNAEKEFADLLTRYKQLLHKHQEVREKWKRTIEKSRKERSKLKARFVAALKEINILKQRLDRIPKGNVEETSSSSSEIEVDQPLYDEQKQQIDGLKSKVSTLQAENSAMKSEIGNLKSQAMGSLRRQLRELPESSDDVSEDVYESLQDKYTSACKEIEYLRSQLDAINGRLLDDLNSEVKGDTDSKPVHSQLAYLKAAGMGDSISESVEFMSTDPHDSDSDTSGDSLDLEMETDYEVLVQEYERLRTQGPAEIQQEYEAVLRRLNLQDVFNSPKRKALNVSDPKECKSDPISSEAQITKGSSSSIVSQRSRQQQLEGLTALPGDNMQDQTIDKQSQPLETLKAQYEEEVEQLRLELEQAKHGNRSSAADHSKKEPKPVGPTSHDGGQHNHEQVTNHHETTTDYSTQIEEIKKTFQIELSTALEAQKQTLEESHRSQLDDLRKQLKDESASELEAQMLSLEKSHKAQLDELRIRLKTEFEEDMERKEQALQEAHQQELKAMEGEWMRSDGEWLVKIEELNSQHKKELAERARGTPDDQYIKELRTQIEQEVQSELRESYTKEMAALQESCEQKLEEQKAKLEMLENELVEAKSQMEKASDAFKLGAQISGTDDAQLFNELKQHNEELLSKNKDYTEEIKQLQEQLESVQRHPFSEESKTLQDLQSEHAREIAQLKEYYEDKLLSKETDFQAEVSQLKDHFHQEINSSRSRVSEYSDDVKSYKDFEYEESESEPPSKSEEANVKIPEAMLINFDDGENTVDSEKQGVKENGKSMGLSALAAGADEVEDISGESIASYDDEQNSKEALKVPVGDVTIDSSQGGFEFVMSDSSEESEEEIAVEVTHEDRPRVDSPFPGQDEDEAEEVETEESVSTERDLNDQMDILLHASFQSGGDSLPLMSPTQPTPKSDSLQSSENQLSQLLQPTVGPTVTISGADDDLDELQVSGAIDVEDLLLQIEKLRSTLEENVKQHEAELQQLKDKHEEELVILQKKLDESYTDEMEKMKTQHELEIQELMKTSSETDEAKVAEVQSKRQAELEEKVKEFEEEINQLKEKHEEDTAKLRKQLDETHAEEIERLEKRHELDIQDHVKKTASSDPAEIKLQEAIEEQNRLRTELEEVQEKYESMREAHEETIASLVEKNESITEEIKALMETDFRELNERNLEELRTELETMQEMTIKELQEQHEQALKDLKEQHSEEMAEREQTLKEEQAEEVNYIRQDLMQKYSMEESDHWTKEIYSLKSELDIRNEELHKVRSDLATAQSQVKEKEEELTEKHKVEIENLIDELGRRQELAVTEARESAVKEMMPRIQQLEKLISEYEEQIHSLDESNDKLLEEKEKYQRELEEKLEEVREAGDDLLQRRIEEELFRQQQELEARHLQQIDLLKEEYEDLLVTKQRQIEALHFSKENESDQMQHRIEQELERQHQELQTLHATETEVLRDRYEGVLKEKMEEMEKLYAVLNDTQNYSQKEIQEEIANKMQEIQTKHNFEMEQLKAEYEALLQSKDNEIQEKVLNVLNRQKSEESLGDVQKATDENLIEMRLQMQAQKISSQAIVTVLEKEINEKARQAEDNSESFQKHLAEMKESLQQEFEVLKGQLLDQHAAAMEAAEEEHHQEIDRMREQHILEMAGSRQDWAATNGHRDQGVESPDSTITIPDGKSSLGSAKDTPDSAGLSSGAGDYSMMLEKLQQERDDLEKERNDFAKQLQQEKFSHQQTEEELEKLRQEHLEHLDDLRVSIQEELLVENQRKLDAMADDLQNAHAAELEKLRKELAEEYQAQINALRSSLKEANYETEKLCEDMEEKHKKEIEELRRQLEEAAENQSAESVQKLKELHSEQLSAAELDTDVAKSELEEAHAWEMQRYKEKLEDLQQEHQLEKQELTQKISDLQQQLISSHGDHDIIEELQQQRNKLKETLSQRTEEVQELTDQLDDSKDRVSELEKRIEDMERQVHEHAESTNAVSEQNKKHEESDMLEVAQQELSTANSEREYLKLMNERLRNVLSETVMTTMTTEERINRQLANLVAEGRKSPSSRSRPGGSGGGDSGADAGVTDDEPTQDGSTLSMFSDEGLDLSQRISESLFVGPDIDSDNDFVYDATNRLQAGVEHILDMITTATRQLHEAQATQRSLVDTLSERNQEIVELQNKLEDQENKFKQEAETREFLAVELNKAEGLLEGYVSEKKQLEETLRTMEEEKETLVADLETARAQLHGFVDSEADLTAREDHIQRQTLALEQSIGQEEQDLVLSPNGTPRQRSSYTGLLQENAKLSTEKRDLEKQFQHESQMLQRRISEMEMNEHDIQAQYEHQLQEKKIEIEDLQRQIQNLDKKVKSNQQFIEEQSAEREQEREESQQEIRMLKDIVKEKEKHQTTESRLQREWSADLSVELDQLKELYEFSKTRALASDRKVQDLEDHLKEKIDAHSELRLKYEQLERDIQGLQVVLRERESLIKQLEEELDAKHQAENDFTDKLKKLEQELARQQEANIELTAELRDNINADELQQAVKDLEAQLEHARTSERLSQERCRQLEEELKNLKTLEEELKADKEVLQKQVYDQLNHISTLKLQVEDMKLNIDQADSKAVKELRQILAQEREALESKDKEMSDLSSQLEQFREQVVDKNDEIQQMAAQLKVTDTKHQHRLVELEELYTKLTEENGKLKKQIADLKAQPDSSPISTFAQNLIDNKNEEIDELNRHVKQLQEELDHVKTTENSSAVDTLKQEIAEKNIEIETKTIEVKELKEQLNINLTTSEEVVKLQEEVAEKEDLVVNLEGQVNTLQQEVKDLSQCQTKLQDDFDEVQKMLDGKQKEVETLHQQLELVQAPSEGISAEVKTQYETETMKLQEMLRTKEDVIEKKEDEVISLQERLEKRAKDVEHLETQVKLLSERLTVLQQQLEGEGELLSNDRDEEVLLAQLQQQSQLIDDLQNQLSQSQTNFKCRQEEFSRAIAELETQRKLPMQQTKGTPVAGVNVEQLKLQYEAEIVRLKEEHEKEIDRIRHLYEIDDADSTFQMERDLKPELDAHSALDGRFMEHIGRHRQAGVGGERSPKASDNPEMSDRLRGVLQNLRRESQRVYSLSQELLLQSQQQVHPSGLLNGDQSLAAWREERQSLLAANRSLKKLLSASQSGDPSKFAEDEDWRADLLHAVTEVFKAETKNMSAQLAAYRKEAGEGDSSFIEKLEKLITEQNERQRTALQSLYEADRQSLMSELQELRGRMNGFQHSSFEEQSRIRDELAALDEQFSKREWHLKRQLELMEYKLQQERVLREDLESSLEKEKSRNMEMSCQLTREKSTRSDLQGDLADTQAQLTKLRDALEREQNRLISSSNALDEERQRTSLLNESLTQERMSSQQVQEDLDFERQRNQRMKDRNHQLVEKLKRETEMEKERRMEAQDSVERERMTLGSLRRELELERDSSRALDHKAKAKIAELKSSLDMERARTEEMNSALQRERQLNAQLREALDEERSSLHDTSSREKAAITDLQAMLDLERSKLLELHTTVEREKNKVHNLNSKLAAEQSRSAEELEHERATCRQLKNSLETLQAQKQELARQAEFEADKVAALQANAERLQASLMSTKDRLREMESVVENARSLERQRLRDWDQERDQERRKQYDKDTELLRLRQKVSDLELQLAEHKRSAMQAFEEKDLTRLKTTFSSHKRSSRSETESVSSIGNIQTNGAGMAHKWQHRQLESFRQRLNLIMIQTQDEIVKATDRLHSDPQAIIDSIDDLSRLYTRLKDHQAELDKLQPSMIRDVEITSGSVAGLNEKILKHNSELSHLLTTLSEEKHEMYRKSEHLRDEVQELRRQLNNNEIDATDERLGSERVLWSQERATLALQKNNAEKEIVHLKAKIRRLEIELEREREKYIGPQSNGEVADREKMQRLYGKYLKAESFKKSLIYQKKYLLILLGGYQDTERETLSMLAKMGGFENGQFQEYQTRLPPLSRFRSAARVIIACSRMKLLVRKWKRATRVGSQPVVGNMQSTSGASASYLPNANGFSPPRTQQYMSHEDVVESRWTSYSYPLHHTPPTKDNTQTSHNRRNFSRRNLDLTGAFELVQDAEVFHDSGAVSPLTNPDEEHSLNAYIEDLEHIQVRLGQVSQGSLQAQR